MADIFLLKFIILLSLPLRIENLIITSRHRKHIYSPSLNAEVLKRDQAKRGLNIGLELKMPTSTNTAMDTDIKTLEKDILRALAEKTGEGKYDDDVVKKVLEDKQKSQNLLLKPHFQCDEWDSKTRTCWLDRNIGDTVTFSLSSGIKGQHGRPDITWKKQFSQKDSQVMKEYTLDRKNSSRNIVIGRRGYELRISPITELDLEENQFSATFSGNTNTPHNQVNFRIRVMPEDLGFVYVGETLDLSIDSHVALPFESMSFYWYTEKEGEFWTLPSNMKVSSTGLTLRISELRQEQEGIVACSVYTNKGVHATKRRFLIRQPANKDGINVFSGLNINSNTEKKFKRHMQIPKKQNNNRQTKLHKNEKKATNWEPRPQRQISDEIFGGEYYTSKEYSDDEINSIIGQDANENSLQEINTSYGNSSDMETVVNINQDKNKNMQDDKISQLISFCTRDVQCSNHASCIRTNLKQNGFCRCLPGFYGPGIFCKEEM